MNIIMRKNVKQNRMLLQAIIEKEKTEWPKDEEKIQ